MHDAGNTTTLSHYLTLLDQEGVLKGLNKFSFEKIRQRQSSPKFQVHNNALMTGVFNKSFHQVMESYELKGRFVESAVGSHLLQEPSSQVYYWRENIHEVDFVVQTRGKTIAIEVKSGGNKGTAHGLDFFQKRFSPDHVLLVGTGGVSLETFFKTPFEHFL